MKIYLTVFDYNWVLPYFVTKNFSRFFSNGHSFYWSPCFYDTPPTEELSSFRIICFLAFLYAPGSSYILSTPVLESTIPLGSLGFFHQRMNGIRNQNPGSRHAHTTGMPSLWPITANRPGMYVCPVDPYMSVFPYITTCGYIRLNMSSSQSPQH
jgi:hypothetical protein